jgi:CYTH domain-containing protein
VEEVFALLGEPIPKEIERKFLIKKPTQEEIDKLGCISKTNIIQTYLYSENENVERRVRQRGTKQEGFSFYYTEKTNIGLGERLEKEEKITPNEYVSYLAEADTRLHQISKIRYCFVFDQKYYEMDIYPFSDDYAIMEIELNDINEEINLPPLNIVKEVTDDDNYKNYCLAKTLSFGISKDNTNEKDDETNWIYETGKEEPEILGSGSSYSCVVTTSNEDSAFRFFKENCRNYLIRKKVINGKTIFQQWYDNYSKSWIDD